MPYDLSALSREAAAMRYSIIVAKGVSRSRRKAGGAERNEIIKLVASRRDAEQRHRAPRPSSARAEASVEKSPRESNASPAAAEIRGASRKRAADVMPARGSRMRPNICGAACRGRRRSRPLCNISSRYREAFGNRPKRETSMRKLELFEMARATVNLK